MSLALAQIAAGWPLALSLATAVAARNLREGRRRTALNEALHELRRPLQALALAVPGQGATGAESSLRLAAAAMERLEREINGESLAAARAPVAVEPLLRAAVARWGGRVRCGGSVELRWRGGEGVVAGDRLGIEAAIDNLLANAVEHGGPRIVVAAERRGTALRVSVSDFGGRRAPVRPRGAHAARLRERLSGRRRRGHGLRVVRRAAAVHGGEFRLRRSARGAEALLELPLSGGGR